MRALIIAVAASLLGVTCQGADDSSEVAKLAAEVRGMGWIVCATISTRGDWDLYLMRPDGSERRAMTQTPD